MIDKVAMYIAFQQVLQKGLKEGEVTQGPRAL
jgi:hypothetical protein